MIRNNIIRLIGFSLALAAFNLPYAHAYQVSIPDYEVSPGSIVHTPVIIDDTAGIASIEIQVNFDSSVLKLSKVTPGQLGINFDLEHELSNGVLNLSFIRSENMSGGGGQLAILEFTANSGATTDLYSDLAIASFKVGDDRALKNLALTNAVTVNSGSIRITNNHNFDNARNGLPDWWEAQYGLNPLNNDPKSDPDGDSINQIFELAFGGNPNKRDDLSIMPQYKQVEVDDSKYISLEFRRRIDETDGLIFRVYESYDLNAWTPIPIASVTVAEDIIDEEMKLITVRSSQSLEDRESERSIFLMLSVQ
ncbi:cohesin domain-containing protein [Cerasicoccus fimbriatus]|uniref:cohesin domain-containing protein n=1 Tax=Cerasicoccus fimbriatus TaxID=3014554 RepID=UPI0022B56FD0|nr:cohesin domain-containing protein [Cerasicoccus sp. TK19100]